MDLGVIFAWIIAILAGAACIGALVVVLVAEWYAIRRTIERHRQPPADPSARYWREHAHLTIPEQQP
jgi:O-antigen ligase